jgi:hypothetical protein
VRLWLEELETRAMLSAAAASPAVLQPNSTIAPLATAGLVSYTPQQIAAAYGINQAVLPNGQQATGAGETIAIVDAYHDPNIQSDLAAFDKKFNLAAPQSFTQVQMNGVTQVDPNWSSETALDVEWAHAVAPQANILLVEAPSANLNDLTSAVRYAANQPGVVAVSMSWGSNEFAQETASDATFTTPTGHNGVTFVASSGDNGAWFGPEWPAVSPNVLAVGGTSLRLTSTGAYSSEKGWAGSGGGYSSFENEPTYQQGVQSSGARTAPDVAYDANPNTGFQVYDSVGLKAGQSGWWTAGGTSAGAPQWAAIIALADQARAANGLGSLASGQAAIYNLPAADFHGITSGGNGYQAHAGYDLVTGRGSPNVAKIVTDLSASTPAAATTTPTVSSSGSTTPTNTGGGTARRHDDGPTSDPVASLPSTPVTGNPIRSLTPLIGLLNQATRPTTASDSQDDSITMLALRSGATSAAAFGSSSSSLLDAFSSGAPSSALGVSYRTTADQPWSPPALSIHGASVGNDGAIDDDVPVMPGAQDDAPPAAKEENPDGSGGVGADSSRDDGDLPLD